jgi:Zn-dependent alcohol dehydrogenase
MGSVSAADRSWTNRTPRLEDINEGFDRLQEGVEVGQVVAFE